MPNEPIVASHSRISFDKYPKLLHVILNLLEAGQDSLIIVNKPKQGATESVFPVLYILQKVLPPRQYFAKVTDLVLSITASPQWIVRDMAARTFAALIASTDASDTVRRVLEPPISNQNNLHGRLLAIKHTIRTRLHFAGPTSQHEDEFTVLDLFSRCNASEVARLFELIEARSVELYQRNQCPLTKAVYVDIVSIFAPFKDLGRLRIHFANDIHLNQAVATDALLQESLENIFRTHSYENGNAIASVATESDGVLSVYQDDSSQSNKSSWASVWIAQARTRSETDLQRFRFYETQLLSAKAPSERTARLDTLSRFVYKVRDAHRDLPLSEIVQPKLDLSLLNESVTDPLSEESVLRLYGLYLEAALSKPFAEHSMRELHTTCDRLWNAIDDNKPATTRLAVAQTLSLLHLSWTPSNYPLVKLKLHLLLQDVLDDDDEEIRLLAAFSVANILRLENNSKQTNVATPSLAKTQHCEYLVRVYSREEECSSLLFYLVAKLTGGNTALAIDRLQLRSLPAQSRLDHILNRPLALFDQEDQNLYRDQTLEYAYCARMIGALIPEIWNREGNSELLLGHLSRWAMECLHTLTVNFEHRKGSSQLALEGPLGWTYNKDAFALAYSVVRSAKLLLIWRADFRRGPIKASSIKIALFNFLVAAEQSNANPHLVELTRKALGESCISTFKALDQKVREILGQSMVRIA